MKLGEVCLLTGDVCRLADFYRKLMDIRETNTDPVHQFITSQEPSLAVYCDGLKHDAARSPVSLAFTVEDIHASYQKLLSLKAEIVQPPTQQPWGAVNLAFRDPDGNLIYLRQMLSKGEPI